MTGYCAWTFEHAANSPYKDSFMARFKLLIDTFGLRFKDEQNLPWETVRKYSMEPWSLTDEEWKITGYPFPDAKRNALIKLVSGEVSFTKDETELLEDLCGDFFELQTGYPKNPLKVNDTIVMKLVA